jgi:aminoglycoside phosphotransferase (APT) family kinase protein
LHCFDFPAILLRISHLKGTQGMQLHLVPRSADVFQQPVTTEQLVAICARAFGTIHPIIDIHELRGGTINTTYRVSLHDHPTVIVRVAPSDANPRLFRHEHHLLRREFFVQPFLAPIGHLLPTLYHADFTHHIIARDILIQVAIPGDLWRDVQQTLTQAAATALWQQLGQIAHQIHRVEHDFFGPADPIATFHCWSDALLMDFQNILDDMAAWCLPSHSVHQARDCLARHHAIFDRIQTPHLLHGDLWLNNLLIQHTDTYAQIVGVLDAGFAHWGDPAADWTMMRMSLDPPVGAELFWAGYGSVGHDAEALLRRTIYQARSLGWSILELQRRQHPDQARLWETLEAITNQL